MSILSFVTLRGGGRIARIEPATAPTAPTGSELDHLLVDAIPHLGVEEAACFDADIREARDRLVGRASQEIVANNLAIPCKHSQA